MTVNAERYDIICIFNPLVDYRFFMHGFITLSDATSYDKDKFILIRDDCISNRDICIYREIQLSLYINT